MTSFASWVSAGRPWHVAQPIADLAAILRQHGYSVGVIGNEAHLRHNPPEDHTPYSRTGWPGSAEYPYVYALDIMPPKAGSGLPSLSDLGAQIIADRNAGVDGIGWLKYINWTDRLGNCKHVKWTPNVSSSPSSDVGHIHLSARSDATHTASSYDPVARVRGLAITPQAGRLLPSSFPTYPGVALKRGSAGHWVTVWQQLLQARGWDIGVDGDFGPETEVKTRAFQRDKGLRVDGVVGPDTWHAARTKPIT
jgi:hypothetical protein